MPSLRWMPGRRHDVVSALAVVALLSTVAIDDVAAGPFGSSWNRAPLSPCSRANGPAPPSIQSSPSSPNTCPAPGVDEIVVGSPPKVSVMSLSPTMKSLSRPPWSRSPPSPVRRTGVIAVPALQHVVAGRSTGCRRRGHRCARCCRRRLHPFLPSSPRIVSSPSLHPTWLGPAVPLKTTAPGRRTGRCRRAAGSAARLDPLRRRVVGIGPVVPRLPTLNIEVGSRRRVRRRPSTSVALDQLGERVALELGQQVEGGFRERLEPVAVLRSSIWVRRRSRTSRPACLRRRFASREAADPQVDVLEAGRGEAVLFSHAPTPLTSRRRPGPPRSAGAGHLRAPMRAVAASRSAAAVVAAATESRVP